MTAPVFPARLAAALEARYRAARAYRLVSRDRLTASPHPTRQPLDEGCVAVLEPRDRGDHRQGVDRHTAALFQRLARPRRIDRSTRDAMGKHAPAVLARLVLDGVLEVETDTGFLRGPAAFLTFFEPDPPAPPRTALETLSDHALTYGAALELDDATALARRLYRYNTLPASPRWRRRLPDRDAAAAFLGLDRYGRLPGVAEDTARSPAWRWWRLAGRDRIPTDEAVHKLYVSPMPLDAPAVLATTLEVIGDELDAHSIKIGLDVYGLLRPDKLVAFFRTREALRDAGAHLATALHGVTPHGVPFTEELAGGGLLSCGVDPPHGDDARRHSGTSWRSRMANRLAAALTAAARDPRCPVEAQLYARRRVELDGVDTSRWAPQAA